MASVVSATPAPAPAPVVTPAAAPARRASSEAVDMDLDSPASPASPESPGSPDPHDGDDLFEPPGPAAEEALTSGHVQTDRLSPPEPDAASPDPDPGDDFRFDDLFGSDNTRVISKKAGAASKRDRHHKTQVKKGESCI